MQVQMEVRPQDILKGDVVRFVNYDYLVRDIQKEPRLYLFQVTLQETGTEMCLYFEPTDKVELLSI